MCVRVCDGCLIDDLYFDNGPKLIITTQMCHMYMHVEHVLCLRAIMLLGGCMIESNLICASTTSMT